MGPSLYSYLFRSFSVIRWLHAAKLILILFHGIRINSRARSISIESDQEQEEARSHNKQQMQDFHHSDILQNCFAPSIAKIHHPHVCSG